MDEEPAFSIIDPMSLRFGNTLAAEFVRGSEIATFPYRPITWSTRDQPTEYAGKDQVLINFIQPEFIFKDPILRKIIAEANGTFTILQNEKRNSNKVDYNQISKTYRSIIRSCIEKLSLQKTKDKDEEYKQYISIFYSIEFIWHLCEIFYLDNSPTQNVVSNLLEWVRFHFPATENAYSELYELGTGCAAKEEYWPTLKGLALQGQLKSIVSLLHYHPKSASPTFRVAEKVLKGMPVSKKHLNQTSFNQNLTFWKKETESKLEANVFGNEPDLEELIKLLLVDTETWNKHIANSSNWYECLPGYLFYNFPYCDHFQLSDFSKKWLNRWARLKGIQGPEMRSNHLESVVFNLITNDLHTAIHSIQTIADNKWFVTHLIDLLYHSGKLRAIEDAAKLRESLLYDFGAQLMSKKSFWHLGIEYLLYSSPQGPTAVEIMLTKIPIENERQALKIIAVAQLHGIPNVEQDISKVLAKRCFDNKCIGNALEWAIRSKDVILITSICDFILKDYAKRGSFLCPKVLENVGQNMFIAQRLLFLAKYFEFTQMYNSQTFLGAAGSLFDLMKSHLAPEYFWPTLLVDTISLLESKDPKILSSETVDVIFYLENYFIPMIEKKKKQLAKKADEPVEILTDYRIENLEQVVDTLRLACARNLSRAFTYEKRD